MTIEVALIISAISLAFWIYSGVANLTRNSKNDTKTDTAQLTTVIVKLDGANSSTLHHIDVFHDAGYFESITSFTWKLFNANYGWGSTNFKVYGVKA